MDKHLCIACSCVVFAVISVGCGPKYPYSGRFALISHYNKKIKIANWTGFGFASPGHAILSPETEKKSDFPNLDRLPQTTTVTWTEEGNDAKRTQTIDLTSVVQAGSDKRMLFELSSDAVWTVSLVSDHP